MPVTLWPSVAQDAGHVTQNPLPQLLQTPSGLAILEMQGSINMPEHGEDASTTEGEGEVTPIGRLVFPDYEAGAQGSEWMKRVYLYVGKHQRMTGEVKKLPKAIAVIRKRAGSEREPAEEGNEQLEIVEIVKFKLLFSTRPEPVGTLAADK